jgi:hypothetical protein
MLNRTGLTRLAENEDSASDIAGTVAFLTEDDLDAKK